MARQRAAENGALLLLASATPSTESFYAAQHGRTQLVRLTQRYGGNPLPTVQIVDMRAELAAGNPRRSVCRWKMPSAAIWMQVSRPFCC